MGISDSGQIWALWSELELIRSMSKLFRGVEFYLEQLFVFERGVRTNLGYVWALEKGLVLICDIDGLFGGG